MSTDTEGFSNYKEKKVGGTAMQRHGPENSSQIRLTLGCMMARKDGSD